MSDTVEFLEKINKEHEEDKKEKDRIERIRNFSPTCCSCGQRLGGSVGGFYCTNFSCELS